MKSLIVLLKKDYKIWLPMIILAIAMASLVFCQLKYWPLQPLWKTYLTAFILQLICWLVIVIWEKFDLARTDLDINKPVIIAYVIGLLWSIIQLIWLRQWWTWLNLISQPFIYLLIALLIIKAWMISIDQINKIRHHNDG